MTKYEMFLTSYYGKELLKKCNIWEKGTFCVYGEDPNVDFGGCHHEPIIGYKSGTLHSVIEWAVSNPAFWGWGCGRIEKIKILT